MSYVTPIPYFQASRYGMVFACRSSLLTYTGGKPLDNSDSVAQLVEGLAPEMNKLRLLRELLMGCKVEDLIALTGEHEGCIGDGFSTILHEVTSAYDRMLEALTQ
jgi:hypothetical protein